MYAGGVIDCDVHHDWPTDEHLVPYLSAGWREYVEGPGRLMNDGSLIPLAPTQLIPNPTGTNRPEAFPGNGHKAGSNYELMKEQLLDPSNMERVILQFGPPEFLGAFPNPYFATEVARAANDWTIDNWLSHPDSRLYGAMLVASQNPEEAAKEIRRVGGHPRIAEVLLATSGLGKPFGHPAYAPIHEAAAEMGLPLAIHTGGEAFPGQGASPIGSGMPSFYFEVAMLTYQGSMTHLTSFITHGVFEKFPALKVLIVEAGVAWVPSLLWRLDTGYKALRREIPWVKRAPSEYFHDHVRMSTQPLDRSPDPEQLVETIRFFGGEDILCFSTDYPHWDTDEVNYVETKLPKEWHQKIFHDNAVDLYGWTDAKGSRPPESELSVSQP